MASLWTTRNSNHERRGSEVVNVEPPFRIKVVASAGPRIAVQQTSAVSILILQVAAGLQSQFPRSGLYSCVAPAWRVLGTAPRT
jgi:hypothetical protein